MVRQSLSQMTTSFGGLKRLGEARSTFHFTLCLRARILHTVLLLLYFNANGFLDVLWNRPQESTQSVSHFVGNSRFRTRIRENIYVH